MDRLSGWYAALGLAVLFVAVPAARAQQIPHIGYIYPAGGRQGTTVDVTVGGQYLNGVSEAYFSGKGVKATIVKHIRPVSRGQLNKLGQKVREIQKRQKTGTKKKGAGSTNYRANMAELAKEFESFAKSMGLKEMTLAKLAELRKKQNDPKRQPNDQIGEIVLMKLTVAKDAEPGERELRLKTSLGITNPIYLHIGQDPEYVEKEPNDKTGGSAVPSLPAILNGQVMPGDVDRFRFPARKGMRLVAVVSARKLVPYLADAVPGWFQATLTLLDAKGKELAYTDDFRFHPDPVIYYEIPADGEYILEIKDAIFRGREDFVYRIVLGEMPFVTGVFPLGGRIGAATDVQLQGWNLPMNSLTMQVDNEEPGIFPVSVLKGKHHSNRMPFALDTLPECLEREPNNDKSKAHAVQFPMIVNGRIDRPGDWDVFRFHGRKGEEIIARVHARRLESPLDSLLKLTDASGKQLAVNDDYVDKSAGLTTHHADSRLSFTLPADGTYLVHLGDTQQKGGSAYAYRLRISRQRPDFELRVVPSSINARAGMSVPITVYALRKDDFAGEISLKLKGSMVKGFSLNGGWIPAGQDKVRMTLTVPQTASKNLVELRLEGVATIGGQQVRRTAVPAEDMMQAFLWRHLVASEDWVVSVGGKRRYGPPLSVLGKGPVKLPAGGTATVHIAGPAGPFARQVKLELSEPPEGIAIQKVSPDPKGLAIVLSVDAKTAKPGLKGNLIVNASMMWAQKNKSGKPTGKSRRVAIGALPAIPFEVVGPRAVAKKP